MYDLSWQDSLLLIELGADIGIKELTLAFNEAINDERFPQLSFIIFHYYETSVPKYSESDMPYFNNINLLAHAKNSTVKHIVVTQDAAIEARATYSAELSKDKPWGPTIVATLEDAYLLMSQDRVNS